MKEKFYCIEYIEIHYLKDEDIPKTLQFSKRYTYSYHKTIRGALIELKNIQESRTNKDYVLNIIGSDDCLLSLESEHDDDKNNKRIKCMYYLSTFSFADEYSYNEFED